MDELLMLTHRIPYPPDKGDKIRSWHFFKHLASRFSVYLGTFVDEDRDWSFVEKLRGMCRDSFFAKLDRGTARLRSLRGLLNGGPLTNPFYSDRALDRWVQEILSRTSRARILIYSSAMAQYITPDIRETRRCVADLVDVDSEKWLEYGRGVSGVKSYLLRREGTKLRDVEREIASTFSSTVVATENERELLNGLAPESTKRIVCIRNGVDAEYFSPNRNYERPPELRGTALVFTGVMDYAPNIDAVVYFTKNIFPLVREKIPDAQFLIVGSNPHRTVIELASGSDIIVTGRVPDVRPYLAHARAVVVPLRIARGVQNKLLEGMAMAKAVIALPAAAVGIEGEAGKEFLVANDPESFAAAIYSVAFSERGDALGQSARQRILASYSWSANAALLEATLSA